MARTSTHLSLAGATEEAFVGPTSRMRETPRAPGTPARKPSVSWRRSVEAAR
jgi:hypothetical protein